MKSLKIFLVLISLILISCSTKECKRDSDRLIFPMQNRQSSVGDQKMDSIKKVKVSKANGSLQCGMGKIISLDEMQKDLGVIQVFKAEVRNDGLMRIQVCGSPTGDHNVFEIAFTDLQAALNAGFKEWIAD